MATVYHNIISSFPRGYCLAFAYGSGVFRQRGYDGVAGNMMDFVFAVNNPLEWHRENLHLNPRHYSTVLRHLGPEQVERLQTTWGASLYYNTLVPTHRGMIKYGVISRTALIADLLDWETLYVAGRLHKPVIMLHTAVGDGEVRRALEVNLYAAVHTALLLLPETFTEEELYIALAGISYAGDFRMVLGEDSDKVRNIVHAQQEEFRALYRDTLQELREFVVMDYTMGRGSQDTSNEARHHHLSMLPKRLQMALVRECNRDGRSRDLEEVLRAAASDPDAGDMITSGVEGIVRRPSMTQALKGVLTAGPFKAVRYAWAKLSKMIRNWQR